jgi:site-specific recombinase XerC
MSRLYDPKTTRRHWVYNRERVCQLFDVCDSTITNWIKLGLRPVDNGRPQIFAGLELRRFITSMRWKNGRPPENGRVFCHFCSGFKPLIKETLQTSAPAPACIEVTGKCIDCHSVLQMRIAAQDLPEIMNASTNTPKDSSDVSDGLVPWRPGRNGGSIPAESNSANLRRLFGYGIYLQDHENLDVRTVDEHLRAISRLSAFLGHKLYSKVTIDDACRFKNELRQCRDREHGTSLSSSTVSHTLDRCRAFFTWLSRQAGVALAPDLAGYFSLSRKEAAAEADMAKETKLTFDQALYIFKGMEGDNPIRTRDRAIVAMFIVTGIRVAALISLSGKHVNMSTRWVNQDPREVNTKNSKRIRTYMLDLGSGLLEAIRAWNSWRTANGFGDNAPFFLADRYIEPNALGFGYQRAIEGHAECWKSIEPVNRIIKDAAAAADFSPEDISSHDFRKCLHPFLAKRGHMIVRDEVALQLNLGHTPTEVTRKHYAAMPDSEREEILDDLCRRALGARPDLQLYLGYMRGEITQGDPDYPAAKALYERNGLACPHGVIHLEC